MKSLALCAVLLAVPLAVHAADKNKAAAMDPQAMQEAMMKAATPGAQHEMLRKMEGDWNLQTTFVMDPSQPPQTAQSTSTVKSIMGGRYTQEEASGDMMGMPFQGMGITGYDNVLNAFVSTWIDNLGTGIMFAKGKGDADGKTIRWNGEMSDPMTGKASKMRMVTTIVDDDHHTFEMFGAGPNGKEMKMMTIEYTRKAAAASN